MLRSGSRETEQKWANIELETGLAEDEGCIEVEVMIKVTYIYDANYGADLDGNRGEGVWFLDESYYEIESCTKDGELTKEQVQELEAKVDKIIEQM